MDRIFKRVPLMAATTAELRDAGSYKAMDAAGVQILITRTQSGQVKAFVNMCSHRGAKLMAEGCGHANKFTVPTMRGPSQPKAIWSRFTRMISLVT